MTTYERFIQFLINCSRIPYKPSRILLATIFGSSLELVIIPAILVFLGRAIDKAFSFKPFFPTSCANVAAVTCFLLGVPWLAWSIAWQHMRGKGTPLPLVPTKVLLIDGPYRYTRNPMALGAILWLSGWSLIGNSLMALLGGVGLFALAVLSYDKWVEEKELSKKFGRQYEIYKKETPFFIPRFKT